MSFMNHLARAIALTFLIFANSLFLNAQTEVPAGTRILIRMDNGIDSGSAGVNDTFTAVTVKPLVIGELAVLPSDSTITGHVTDVVAAGHGGRSGILKLEFDAIRFPGGTERPLSAVLVNEFPVKKAGTFNALAILGGTAIGGLIGLVTKSNSGAAIGAGAGAGAGTGIALARKGKNVGIKSNEEFEIELTKAVMLPADGY